MVIYYKSLSNKDNNELVLNSKETFLILFIGVFLTIINLTYSVSKLFRKIKIKEKFHAKFKTKEVKDHTFSDNNIELLENIIKENNN